MELSSAKRGMKWPELLCSSAACLLLLVGSDSTLAQPASVSTLPPVTNNSFGNPGFPNQPGFPAQPGFGPQPTVLPAPNLALPNTGNAAGIRSPGFVPLNPQPAPGMNPNPSLTPQNPSAGTSVPLVPQGIYPQSTVPTLPSSPNPWVLPGANPSALPQGAGAGLLAPVSPFTVTSPGMQAGPVSNAPREVVAPIDVWLQERRTGRAIIGGTVNSELGVAGKIILEERDFDWRQLTPDNRFLRGGGQHLRMEIMPGNEVQRYTVNWTQPNLLGYSPYSLSLGGFYYTRRLRDWSEQRGGGRIALGFDDRRGFSISSELRAEDVILFRPRVGGVTELESALGSNDIYRARFRVARDSRDSPFLSRQGGLLELIYDQVFGEYDYPRGQINWLRYWTLYQPLDPQAGARTLTHSWKFGLTGSQTPLFENFYAGGFSTLRGFDFRGASPRVSDVEVGGEFMFLGSLEYALPITADNMLRGVAFVDYGTVEPKFELNTDDFRVSLGLGMRLFVPALSPAPFAFDFAYPVKMSDTDERQIFSFFVGATR